MNKSSHNVTKIADDVKARLRRIAHSITEEQLNEAVASFKSWEHYEGQLKKWFAGTSNASFFLISMATLAKKEKQISSFIKKLLAVNFIYTLFLTSKFRLRLGCS